jgi:hypothetical protein
MCRQLGCSEASFLWKKRYGNLGMTEVRSFANCATSTLEALVQSRRQEHPGEVVRKSSKADTTA